MRNLNDIFCLLDSDNPSENLQIAYESQMDGNSRSAHEHIQEMIYDELSNLPLPTKTETLYRFSSFPFDKKNAENDPVIKDIRADSITVSNPKNFNDPMDPLLRTWLDIRKRRSNQIEKKMFKMFKNICGQIRIACLCSYDILSTEKNKTPLMWAHYAKNHSGVCVQYEISPENISSLNNNNTLVRLLDVRYRDYKAMSDYISIDNALLAKSDCWDYEKESRLIYFQKEIARDEKGKKPDYITIPGFKIKAVFMGCRISNEHKSLLIENCRKKRIPLYKMEFNMYDITKLIATKLK